MSVAVSCNLSEGVVLGVDSAVVLPAPGGIAKVYENAHKLFQLGDKPIGLAVFGLATLIDRSVGSYIREFETKDPGGVVAKECPVSDVVEALRRFLLDAYHRVLVPGIEQETGRKFDEISPQEVPTLGLVVGGFSSGEYLSEVWEILIPHCAEPQSCKCRRSQGEFGTDWFAMCAPIHRYIKGFDPGLIDELLTYVQGLRAKDFAAEERDRIKEVIAKYEYRIPFAAMPLEEGVAHTRFLAELVVSHHRYAVGAPVVGGAVRLGKVTYKGEKFQLLQT